MECKITCRAFRISISRPSSLASIPWTLQQWRSIQHLFPALCEIWETFGISRLSSTLKHSLYILCILSVHYQYILCILSVHYQSWYFGVTMAWTWLKCLFFSSSYLVLQIYVSLCSLHFIHYFNCTHLSKNVGNFVQLHVNFMKKSHCLHVFSPK